MGLSMKKYTIRLFLADRTDVITSFAIITNVVIKRVHCTSMYVLYTLPKVKLEQQYRVESVDKKSNHCSSSQYILN